MTQTHSLKLAYGRWLRIPLKLSITWTELGLWLIVLLGSFLGLFKRYLPISDGVITVLYDLLCFGLLAYVLLGRLLRSRRLPFSRATWPILAFTGFAFLTILNPLLTSYGRGLLGWRFLASAILLHFLGFYALRHPAQIWRLLKLFWLTAALTALYGLWQQWQGYTAVDLAWIEELAATMRIAGTGRYRLMSSFGSAVDFGFYLALAITTLAAPLLFRWRHYWPYSIPFALLLTAVLFTYVRAAWAAAFVGLIWLVGLYIWRNKRLRLLYPILLSLGLMLLLLTPSLLNAVSPYITNPALQQRIVSLADPLDDKSMQDRFERWADLWQPIRQYPQGVGVGMTGAASLRYADEKALVSVTSDNTYLRILVEMGWFGLVLFIWLLTAVLLHALRLSRCLPGDLRLLARAFTAAHIAFIVILFFGEYIELNPARSLIWIFSGILYSLPRYLPVPQP